MKRGLSTRRRVLEVVSVVMTVVALALIAASCGGGNDNGGGELMVVRQNAHTSFEDAENLRGQAVTLAWGREYTRIIGTKEEDS